MPFTETDSAATHSNYVAFMLHAATGHGVSVKIISNDANGTIPEEVAEQIFTDIASILSGDTRFTDASVTRTRPAVDAWAPPVPPVQ